MKATRKQRSDLRKQKFWAEREKAAGKTRDPEEQAVLAWAQHRAALKALPRDVADQLWRRTADMLADLRKPADHKSHLNRDHTHLSAPRVRRARGPGRARDQF